MGFAVLIGTGAGLVGGIVGAAVLSVLAVKGYVGEIARAILLFSRVAAPRPALRASESTRESTATGTVARDALDEATSELVFRRRLIQVGEQALRRV